MRSARALVALCLVGFAWLLLRSAAVALGGGGGAVLEPIEVQQVAVGDSLSCAIRADAAVTCWGEQFVGNDPPPTTSSSSTVPTTSVLNAGLADPVRPPDGPFVAIDVEDALACGIRADQTASCWGYTDFSAWEEPPVDALTSIAVGRLHACGLRLDENVVCWGSDDLGQASPPAGAFEAIAAGDLFTCGLRGSGAIECWGRSTSGETDSPVGAFTAVSAGLRHACALDGVGEVSCWGDDSIGQATPPAGPFVAVVAGGTTTCALAADGAPTCWGNDTFGQASPPGTTFDAIAVGDGSACGVDVAGRLQCWGDPALDRSGQPTGSWSDHGVGEDVRCGIDAAGDVSCTGTGPLGTATPPTGPVSGLAVGDLHACALDATLQPACWGVDTYGQSSPPSVVVREVAVGSNISCAVDGDGGIQCWGRVLGQQDEPPSGASFDHVAVGPTFACGVETDGSVACWGTTPPSGTPSTGSYVSIDAEGGAVCALRDDLEPTCWGQDTAGETTPPAGPFTEVEVAERAACGIRPGGSIECWGDWHYGQHDAPAGAFHRLDGGGLQHCAVRISDGVHQCWGQWTSADASAAPPDPARVAGVVTEDGTGNPLQGISVRLLTSANALVSVASTGADGSYAFEPVAPGPYLLRFVDGDGSHVGELFEDAEVWTDASVVAVPTAATVQIDVALSPAGGPTPAGTVAGTVTESGTGTGLGGISVRVLTTSGVLEAVTTTAADGSYAIAGLPVGDHLVRFVDLDGSHVGELYDEAASVATASAVAVAAGATTVVDEDLAAASTGDIVGTVTEVGSGVPLSGISVRLLSTGGALLGVRVTDAAGGYSFLDRPPGTYLVRFIDLDDSHFDEWHLDAASRAAATSTVLGAGSVLTVDAQLLPWALGNGTLTMTVLEQGTNLPLSGISVRLLSPEGVLVATRISKADGTATFRDIPPLSYKVRFIDLDDSHEDDWFQNRSSLETAIVLSFSKTHHAYLERLQPAP